MLVLITNILEVSIEDAGQTTLSGQRAAHSGSVLLARSGIGEKKRPKETPRTLCSSLCRAWKRTDSRPVRK